MEASSAIGNRSGAALAQKRLTFALGNSSCRAAFIANVRVLLYLLEC